MDEDWVVYRNCHSGWQRITYLALGFTWQTLIIFAELSSRLSPDINSKHQSDQSVISSQRIKSKSPNYVTIHTINICEQAVCLLDGHISHILAIFSLKIK